MKPQQWLVPELLGESQPNNIQTLLEVPGLGFRYQFDILPEGLLPRFLVQTHLLSEGNPHLRWRTGVVLEWEGSRAIVRAEYRERRVEIHVTGPLRKRLELLAVIRERLREQFDDLRGITVNERVVVPGEKDENGREVTASYKDLLQREQDGEIEYRPEGAKRKTILTDLLDGVESPDSRMFLHKNAQSVKNVNVIQVFGSARIKTGDTTMEKITNIKINKNYGQVGNILQNCTNIINEQADSTLKQILEKLQDETTLLIQSLLIDQPKMVAKAAKNLKRLVEEATDKQPEREWYSISAKGLLEASEFVKGFSENIGSTILNLGKHIWQDFKLSEIKSDNFSS